MGKRVKGWVEGVWVRERVSVSDVINLGVELVIIMTSFPLVG